MKPELNLQDSVWPALHLRDWKDTRATLHMWTQIVGKIRMAQSPEQNHWWHVPLYLTTSGLTTSPIPYAERSFEIDFDFIRHQLQIRTNEGDDRTMALRSRSVAEFYREFMGLLNSLDIEIEINTVPCEVPDPIPFNEDTVHATYDPEYANRFWRVLAQADRVFKSFRSGFIGKCSPVHFFWGSFDLAVTRFSGRRAPEREGADPVTKEAYSHEVISHGFWPGSGVIDDAAFYSYTSPEPEGLKTKSIRPPAARYDTRVSEFILSYEDVRTAPDPDTAINEFLQSTYEAGADLANWDRKALER